MPLVREIGPGFVAEIDGLDLSAPLERPEIEALVAALDRYAVVVFHDQPLDQEQQVRFARHLGELESPRTLQAEDGQRRLKYAELTDISNLDAQGRVRRGDDRQRMYALGNRLWHTDGSFRAIPARYSMLSAHSVPRAGGETEFADMRAAYDALSPATRASLEDLAAEHSIFHSRSWIGFDEFTDEERRALPPVVHPLVRVHPGSQRKSLYLASHASHVVARSLPEGRILLHDLREHATDRAFVYRHHWRVGDFVIWDNRCTMHRGRPYDETERRDLRRVSTRDVAGTPAFAGGSTAGSH